MTARPAMRVGCGIFLACVVSRDRVIAGQAAVEVPHRMRRPPPSNSQNCHNPLPKRVHFDGHSFHRLWLTDSEPAVQGICGPGRSILPHGVGLIRKSSAERGLSGELGGTSGATFSLPGCLPPRVSIAFSRPICRPPSFQEFLS